MAFLKQRRWEGAHRGPRFVQVPDFGFDVRPEALTLRYFRLTFIVGFNFQFL